MPRTVNACFTQLNTNIFNLDSKVRNVALSSRDNLITSLHTLSDKGLSMANGDVEMFKCGYGNNPFFFLFGGLIGTSMLAFVSMRLDNLFSTFVSTISKGNIVILGLHFQLIRMSTSFVDSIMQEPFTRDLITLFLSGVIIICFVPIIFLIQKYIPIVIGNR